MDCWLLLLVWCTGAAGNGGSGGGGGTAGGGVPMFLLPVLVVRSLPLLMLLLFLALSMAVCTVCTQRFMPALVFSLQLWSWISTGRQNP